MNQNEYDDKKEQRPDNTNSDSFSSVLADKSKRMTAITYSLHRKKQKQKRLHQLQKKKYQRNYQRIEKSPKVRTVFERGKELAKEFAKNNTPLLAVIGILSLLFLVLSVSLSSCSTIFQGGGTLIMATTYPSSDQDIYDVEERYCQLERALNDQVNQMETRHPNYDEYRYIIDEMNHNPYHLISYLTAKYGDFTYSDVESELQNLLQEQYTLTTNSFTETIPNDETEDESDVIVKHILSIRLTNHGFDSVARSRLNTSQLSAYETLNQTLGNRDYLFDQNLISSGNGDLDYEIPPEALTDERFANMIREAEKYLGYPYVWGGASPATSFDCSGFVSWVINNCGNGWNYGRLTANGLRNICIPISPNNAMPGDLIFFQNTYNTSGASHVGIYVGNGMMIHCGSPIQYANINSAYWQSHFLGYGRIP